jgi:hypothetical protein
MPLKLVACIAMLMITSSKVFAGSENVLQVATIVERHIQALGGRDKINHVTATITRGEYREGKFVAPGA